MMNRSTVQLKHSCGENQLTAMRQNLWESKELKKRQCNIDRERNSAHSALRRRVSHVRQQMEAIQHEKQKHTRTYDHDDAGDVSQRVRVFLSERDQQVMNSPGQKQTSQPRIKPYDASHEQASRHSRSKRTVAPVAASAVQLNMAARAKKYTCEDSSDEDVITEIIPMLNQLKARVTMSELPRMPSMAPKHSKPLLALKKTQTNLDARVKNFGHQEQSDVISNMCTYKRTQVRNSASILQHMPSYKPEAVMLTHRDALNCSYLRLSTAVVHELEENIRHESGQHPGIHAHMSERDVTAYLEEKHQRARE